ncbi:MAG: glycosyltransferase, partial [Candidatus Aenigmatarchaeota archaeon]
VPEIMAAADILVLPGGNNPFDNERFPSKLSEYFAMGRPLVLVKNNQTINVEHLSEAYLLAKADAESISMAIKNISKDEKLRKILSEGSLNFYINKLVDANNETLYDFYKGLIEGKSIVDYIVMKAQRSFRKNYKLLNHSLNWPETLSVSRRLRIKSDIYEGHGTEIGISFDLPSLVTYREHQLYDPLPFTSRKKKLYILTNEDIKEEMLSLFYIIEHFAWINFVDCILVSERGNISLWNRLLPIFKNNRHFYLATPKKNFDNFIKECIGGLQKLHDKLIIFSNPYYLSPEAIEFADGIILDLRRWNDDLEYIPFSILTDYFIKSFQFRYKDVRNSIPFTFDKNDKIDCTLITSIFKSDKFIKNFYNNITRLEGYDQNIAHVILISSISDYELEIIHNWFNNYRNIIIVWQRNDPGLYECWNIGIRLAKSEFISNANVDDMRHPKQVQTLLNDLKSRPHVAIACTTVVPFYNLVSDYKEIPLNEIWYTHQVGEFSFKDLAYLEKDETGNYHLKPHNIPHCMPIWRKRLHEDYGYFDEKNYGTYADWAFWLKVTYLGEIGYLNPEPLSFYFVNLDSHNRRGDKLQEFHKRIEKEFIPYFYWINLERVK